MTDPTETITLAALPRAFAISDQPENHDLVDIELINAICRTHPQPGKKARAMLELSLKVRPSKNDDALAVLAQHVQFPEFRSEWYSLSKGGNQLLPPLYDLVDTYISQQCGGLEFKAEKLKPCFEKRKGKTFPKLDKIPALCDQIEVACGSSPRFAALFAWSLIERTQWFYSATIKDHSLRKFSGALLAELHQRDKRELLDLLEPGHWLASAQDSPSPACPELVHTPKASNHAVEAIESGESDKDDATMSELESNINSIEECVDELHRDLSQRAKTLRHTASVDDLSATLREISKGLDELANEADSIVERSSSLVDSLLGRASADLEPFGISLQNEIRITLNLANSNDWASFARTLAQDAAQITQRCASLTVVAKSCLHEYSLVEPVLATSLSHALELLSTKEQRLKTFAEGAEAHKRITETMAPFSTDFSWNPLTTEAIDQNDWLALGRSLVSGNEWSPTLGVLLRCHFDALRDVLPSLLEAIRNDTGERFPAFFDTLSLLTLDQIEALVDNHPVTQTVLGLVELQAFLDSVEDANSLSEHFGYWSAKPLVNLSQIDPKNHPPFFKGAFEFFRDSSDTSSQPMSLLREAFHRSRNLALPSLGADATQHLEQRLRDILVFHPGGGQNYAALWKQAYEMLCTPILIKLEGEGLQSALQECRATVSKFAVDEHLHRWKQVIPDQLRNRSEYERKIRLAAGKKISELKEFLAASNFSDTGSSTPKSEAMDGLTESMRSIFSGSDLSSATLRRWMALVQETSSVDRITHLERTGSLDPSLASPIKVSRSIRYPRCAAKEAKRESVTAGDHLGDILFADLLPINEQTILEAFLDQGFLEHCCRFETEIGTEAPPDLQRRIQHAIEAKEESYRKRVEELSHSINTPATPDELESNSLREIHGLLNEQRWGDADQELDQLEALVSANALARNELTEIDRLRDQVRNLGEKPPESASRVDLERLVECIKKTRIGQNATLPPLQELIRIPELDPSVRELAESLVSSMISSDARIASSDLAALFISEVFDHLRQELIRSRNLRESYRAKLLELTRNILHFMQPSTGGFPDDGSPMMRFLGENSEEWKKIPVSGEDIVGHLIDRLEAQCGKASGAGLPDHHENPSFKPAEGKSPAPSTGAEGNDAPLGEITLLISPLEAKLRSDNPKPATITSPREAEIEAALLKENWAAVEALSARGYLASPDSNLGRFHLAGWGASKLRKAPDTLSTEEIAAALALANVFPEHPVFKGMSPQRGSPSLLSDLARKLVARIVRENGGRSANGSGREHLQELAANWQLLGKYRIPFATVFSADTRGRGTMLRALWDAFPREPKQAEARADLMTILWHLSATNALSACLSYPPINLDSRKASALAEVSGQALNEGRPSLLQSFFDLKKSVEAKPFALFVDALRIPGSSRSDAPAKLHICSTLNPIPGGAYQAVLAIYPRASERPETLELTLPGNSTIRFHDGQAFRKELDGPFLADEKHQSITFDLVDSKVTRFSERISCKAVSINGETSTFTADLDFEIASALEFSPPTATEIIDAFANFPAEQMRNEDYVVREDDERKIERSLFAKTVSSLWITSPRRSGKTTMLFRILDHYSHKSGRGDLVVFFTLNRSFQDPAEFNRWIWTELRTATANKELRALFDNFEIEIGSELPFDASVATFINDLSGRLKKKCRDHSVDRVIYLIDEIDRFATMHFDGGVKKDAATDILWQIRELLSSSRDIGFVFAGSAAANRIFVASSDAPFFNRNIGFELTPFSCEDRKLAHAARQIVEPSRLKGRFVMNNQTLKHLLWLCAGIPYYMKLLAGATYAVARQPNLVPADVNRGLWALLEKNTGISRLDGSADIPGSDELRTIALAKGEDKTLLTAVVYAAAETNNPLSGRPLRRAQLYSDDAILTTRFRLSKKRIQRGIELATTYGILKASSDNLQEISFGIPFLGEAIGKNTGHFWGQIAHELDEMTEPV